MTTTYHLLAFLQRTNRLPITDYLITDYWLLITVYLLFAEVLHIITRCFIESQTVKFAVGSDRW